MKSLIRTGLAAFVTGGLGGGWNITADEVRQRAVEAGMILGERVQKRAFGKEWRNFRGLINKCRHPRIELDTKAQRLAQELHEWKVALDRGVPFQDATPLPAGKIEPHPHWGWGVATYRGKGYFTNGGVLLPGTPPEEATKEIEETERVEQVFEQFENARPVRPEIYFRRYEKTCTKIGAGVTFRNGQTVNPAYVAALSERYPDGEWRGLNAGASGSRRAAVFLSHQGVLAGAVMPYRPSAVGTPTWKEPEASGG